MEKAEIEQLKNQLAVALSDKDIDNPIIQFTVKKDLFIKMAVAYLATKL